MKFFSQYLQLIFFVFKLENLFLLCDSLKTIQNFSNGNFYIAMLMINRSFLIFLESLLSLKKGKLLGILSDTNSLVGGDDILGRQTKTAGESSKVNCVHNIHLIWLLMLIYKTVYPVYQRIFFLLKRMKILQKRVQTWILLGRNVELSIHR